MLPDEIRPAMQGVVPSALVTCSLDGTPNSTLISQVYYIDETHVALSYQFFNKTIRNVHENPHLAVVVVDADNYQNWYLEVQFDHEETEGALFDQMEMQLEAIASTLKASAPPPPTTCSRAEGVPRSPTWRSPFVRS